MLISIITVTYNSENTIRDTIESVLAQDHDEVEYLLIDGASTDSTVQIAGEYEQAFADRGFSYRIISEPDKGIYDAMNKGIRSASGEIIGIINSDDWYENNALSVVSDTYSQEPFDIFYADINLVKENGMVLVKHSRMDSFPSSRHWNHPTTFVTKKTYSEIGVFKCNGLYDDFDLLLRIRRAGKRVVIRNTVIANFRTGGVSTRKNWSSLKKRFRNRMSCYADNGYKGLKVWCECIFMELGKLVLG